MAAKQNESGPFLVPAHPALKKLIPSRSDITLWQDLREGKVPFVVPIGGRYMIPSDKIEKLLEMGY